MGLDTPQARRSINLAISARGIAALEAVDSDMGKRVLGDMMPMRGRLVHRSNGSESKQPYDITGQVRPLYPPPHFRLYWLTPFRLPVHQFRR